NASRSFNTARSSADTVASRRHPNSARTRSATGSLVRDSRYTARFLTGTCFAGPPPTTWSPRGALGRVGFFGRWVGLFGRWVGFFGRPVEPRGLSDFAPDPLAAATSTILPLLSNFRS